MILLGVLLLSVTGSIDSANWTDGLGLLTWAVLGGMAGGIVLARLPVRGLFAHGLMIALGVPAIVSLATLLLPPVLTFQEKLVVLQERIQTWSSKVAAGKEGSDSLIFVIQLLLMMWIIGYVAAWFVYRRHQVWGAILLPGLALLINLFYAAPQTGFYLGAYLLCALLLLVRLNLHALEEWWRGAAIGYASDISFDFLLYGAMFALTLMFVAWLVPASAPSQAWLSILDPLQEPWQGIEDQYSRVFNTLRAVGRPDPSTFFGTALTMGGPVQLGQRPVMDIQADTGRYWRAMVYDKYTGIGWISTHVDALKLGANDPRLGASQDFLRVDVTQTVRIYVSYQNILYAAAQPIRFDVPTEVRYGQAPATDFAPAIFDLTLVRARRPLREGDAYHVTSSISIADEDSLREASIRYSDWISATYLQLPENLPARVHDLAQSITDKYSNPYDKAAAIESYLRTAIKYNDSVSEPPIGRDGVDYTLFDRPEGYCNYYASAMAVMLRSIGIPARVASGYTLGDYQNGAYRVVEANAHSWPEVYFPGYGWIEFEPTANKPEIKRPKRQVFAPQNPDLEAAAEAARHKKQLEEDLGDQGFTPGAAPFDPFSVFWNNPGSVALASGGLIAVLVVGVFAIRRWRRLRRLAPAAYVYEEMLDRARWLGVREQKHATPFERAHAIGDVLPDARGDVDCVASLYAREKFGARALDAVDRETLSNAWKKFGGEWWRAFVARIIGRIVTPPRQFVEGVKVRVEHWGGNIPQ